GHRDCRSRHRRPGPGARPATARGRLPGLRGRTRGARDRSRHH
ncbi:MAG: hypothetical protein AVDCRST_MAG51-2844, partial [uncultured Ramlibacter sp.]